MALYDQLREDYELTGNINGFAFDVNADAVATAVYTFAFDTSMLPSSSRLAPTTARVTAHEDATSRAA